MSTEEAKDIGKDQKVPRRFERNERDHHKKSSPKVVYVPKKEVHVQDRFAAKKINEIEEFRPTGLQKTENKENPAKEEKSEKKLNIKSSLFQI